jgi:hypothetical protein
MKTISRLVSLLAIAAAMAGCAGTNFKRPDAGALEVGKSTSTHIAQVMGQPLQTGESLRNGEKLKVLRYAYAEGAGTGKYPGVVPARAMVFITHNDLLVAEEFVSSFSTDATDFDEGKVPSLVKGKTTRNDVIALFGKPTGTAVHPFIKTKGESAALYTYAQAKGNAFNMKFYNKSLIVSFDRTGIVTDVEFTSTGEK